MRPELHILQILPFQDNKKSIKEIETIEKYFDLSKNLKSSSEGSWWWYQL